MKKTIILLACVLIGVTFSSCADQTKDPAGVLVHSNVINQQNFTVAANEIGLETETQGTIFVISDENAPQEIKIVIIANFLVDENDWAGVAYGFPQAWTLTRVLSTCPDNLQNPEDYTTIWQTGSDKEWHISIVVGHSKFDSDLSGGGEGNLLIELILENPDATLPDSFDVLIGTGSKGDHVAHPAKKIISVPLTR